MAQTRLYSHQQLMNDPTLVMGQVPLIAHGDSWFSFGDFFPTKTRSLLDFFQFGRDAGIVNYAMPGQKLKDYPDPQRYAKFHLAMTLRGMPRWGALLLSGGGNDMIAWLRRGPGTDLSQRLLRAPAEWLPEHFGPLRYVSEHGWSNLCAELLQAYTELDTLRDQCANPQAPMVTHVYDYMVPRFAYAAGGLAGPWCAPSLQTFQIPAEAWAPIMRVLVDWNHSFLTHTVQNCIGNFVVLDTRGVSQPAEAGSTGRSGDWQNEIHLTPEGYDKLARRSCNDTLASLVAGYEI